MGVLQHRTARDDFDVRALERRRIGELEPCYLAILVGDQLRPVERRFVEGPAVTRGVLEVVGKTCRVDQQFLGNAAADHAGAADAKLLRHHDARAIAGSDPRRAHTARAGPDDEEIDHLVGHVVLSNQPRGRSSERKSLAANSRTSSARNIASSDFFLLTRLTRSHARVVSFRCGSCRSPLATTGRPNSARFSCSGREWTAPRREASCQAAICRRRACP